MTVFKLFHSYVGKRKKECPPVGPLRSKHWRVVLIPSDLSQLLTDAFSAVFWGCPFYFCSASELWWCVEWCLSESVVKVVFSLNCSSAAGPEGLHPIMLKTCTAALSLPFYHLFVRSLDEGVLPDLWKITIVAPLYKNGSRFDHWIIVLWLTLLCAVRYWSGSLYSKWLRI